MAPDDTRVHSALSAKRSPAPPRSSRSNAAIATSVNASSATHARMIALVTCLLIVRLLTISAIRNRAKTDNATSMAPSVKMPSSVLV